MAECISSGYDWSCNILYTAKRRNICLATCSLLHKSRSHIYIYQRYTTYLLLTENSYIIWNLPKNLASSKNNHFCYLLKIVHAICRRESHVYCHNMLSTEDKLHICYLPKIVIIFIIYYIAAINKR